MRREFDPAAPEWMDIPQPVTAELRSDLENLRKLNVCFGSHALVLGRLQRWLRAGESYRVLDLATGYGDIPRAIAAWARKRGITVAIDAVDFMEATLTLAKEKSPGNPEIRYVQADVREFTAPEPYDVVLCSLALHHFTEEDAVRILCRMRALSRGWMLAADLERSRIAQAAIWLLTTVWMREPMTVNDARVSIRRAFSFGEMRALAERAGWGAFAHRRFPVARQFVSARASIQG